MLKLYRLSASQAEAAALVGVNDIERRQHIHQLTLAVLAGCKQASQPFTWIRAAGLRSIAAALPVGLKDGQALMAVLEATYSQVLEVILSTLDRDLIPPNPAEARIAAACHQQRLASQQDAYVHAAELLAAVDRFPAGYAPAAACTQELLEAFQLLQVLCLMSRKVRSLLSKAQHLQLITARACEAAVCLPAAMKALLALLQGNEEAQGLFVTTGGLDMLLTRTLQHLSTQVDTPTASTAHQQEAGADMVSQGDPAAASAAAARKHLAVELLLFLQLLQHWVIADAVNAGAHPSTQRAALALSVSHLGPDIAAAVMQQEAPAAGSGRSNAGSSSSSTGGAIPATSQASSPGGHPDELLMQARAEAAAKRLLQQL